MFRTHRLRALTTSLLCTAAMGSAGALSGCGHGPVANAHLAPARGLAARGADPWYNNPVVLEDFEGAPSYQAWGQKNLFFNVPLGNIVPYAPGGQTRGHVMELLAPEGEAAVRRGAFISQDVRCATADDTHGFAPHIMLSFDWANNGVAVPGPASYVHAIFIFTYSTPGNDSDHTAAIAYAWIPGDTVPANATKNYLRTQLDQPWGDSSIPLRILPIKAGPGGVGDPASPQPCSLSAMNALVLKTVQPRQLEKDAAIAYPELFAGVGPADEGKLARGTDPMQPDERYQNNAITGIVGLGAGCNLPQQICSHAILDNFKLRRLAGTLLADPAAAPAAAAMRMR